VLCETKGAESTCGAREESTRLVRGSLFLKSVCLLERVIIGKVIS
jgi:hypothetical protein